jgi:glutaredoxin
VRDFLTQYGVPFVERNIRKDPRALDELLDRTGRLVVPVLFVGDEPIVGWDEERMRRLVHLRVPLASGDIRSHRGA